MSGVKATTSLKRAQHVIGATELDFAKQLPRQIKAVFRQKRQNGKEALLQVAVGINQVDQILRVFGCMLIAAHGFARNFAFQFGELIIDLRGAFARGGFQRWIKMQQAFFQLGQCSRR